MPPWAGVGVSYTWQGNESSVHWPIINFSPLFFIKWEIVLSLYEAIKLFVHTWENIFNVPPPRNIKKLVCVFLVIWYTWKHINNKFIVIKHKLIYFCFKQEEYNNKDTKIFPALDKINTFFHLASQWPETCGNWNRTQGGTAHCIHSVLFVMCVDSHPIDQRGFSLTSDGLMKITFVIHQMLKQGNLCLLYNYNFLMLTYVLAYC